MFNASAKAMQANLSAEMSDEQDDSISFTSLVRKLVAFTVVIFLFYFAVPLPDANQAIVSGLGIEGTWYRDIPVAICVAIVNASIAVASFRLVR